jgi:hypothetical protein
MKLATSLSTVVLALSSTVLASSSPLPQSSSAHTSAPLLEPIRQGTLHYSIHENGTSRSPDSRTVIGRYQDICEGEVQIPVFDSQPRTGGVILQPQQIKCQVLTDTGEMEVLLGLYVQIGEISSLADKSVATNKTLHVSFSLSGAQKRISSNYFQTRTRDVSVERLDLQTQTDSVVTKLGSNDVTDSFSIRAEFVDSI